MWPRVGFEYCTLYVFETGKNIKLIYFFDDFDIKNKNIKKLF